MSEITAKARNVFSFLSRILKRILSEPRVQKPPYSGSYPSPTWACPMPFHRLICSCFIKLSSKILITAFQFCPPPLRTPVLSIFLMLVLSKQRSSRLRAWRLPWLCKSATVPEKHSVSFISLLGRETLPNLSVEKKTILQVMFPCVFIEHSLHCKLSIQLGVLLSGLTSQRQDPGFDLCSCKKEQKEYLVLQF